MSGLTHSSDLGASGLSGGWRQFRLTATNSAWGIPSHAAMLYIEVVGGGGAGGGGWEATGSPHDVSGDGGGGGGAFAWGMYSVDSLKTAGITTLNVTVGATADGVSGTNGADGNDGNTSSVIGTATTSGYGNMTLRAYGGGAGQGPASSYGGNGGGGGGTGSSGVKPSGNDYGRPGKPWINGVMNGGMYFALGGGGGAGAKGLGTTLATCGKSAEYGGGGGGSSNNSTAGGSIFGAGGGGGDGGWYVPTHGGAWGNYTQGGAANGAENGDAFPSSAPANAGTSRLYGCGDGGAGLHDDEADHAAEIGGAGGVPGGGGGGSGKNTSGPSVGGAGARGEVRIWAI